MLNIFKVNNKETRTPLAFRIFDSIRHHFISSAFKNMFRQRYEMSKKVTKSKIGSKDFNLTKKCFHSTDILKQISIFFFFFFCSSNFLAQIILHPKTVKLNVTKSYILVDLVRVLAPCSQHFYAEWS